MHRFHHDVHKYAFDLPGLHRLLADPGELEHWPPALSVMSWNAGSLSAQQWHELQEWASTCPYHALCIQETHWTGAPLNFVPTDGMLWQVAMTPPGDPQPRALALQAGLIQCIFSFKGSPASRISPAAHSLARCSQYGRHFGSAIAYIDCDLPILPASLSASHSKASLGGNTSVKLGSIRNLGRPRPFVRYSSSQRPILDYRTSALSC